MGWEGELGWQKGQEEIRGQSKRRGVTRPTAPSCRVTNLLSPTVFLQGFSVQGQYGAVTPAEVSDL